MQEAPDATDLGFRVKAHRKENRRLILILLAVWSIFTFIPPAIAIFLTNIHILTGFPPDYYLLAQGSPIIFLLEIVYYAFKMQKIDKKYGLEEEL